MSDDFRNVYEDERRAEAYSRLDFPGTYHLAYRDLPALFARHVHGRRALDFGCGAGRSTRFLRGLGFETTGIDVSAAMLAEARRLDPEGDYHLVAADGPLPLPEQAYDLVLSAFTFDNVPTMDRKVSLFRMLRDRLGDGGRVVSVVSAPEIYVNEWASFTTKDFPENRAARSGDTVRIVMLDVEDSRPVEDVVWSDEDYAEVHRRADLLPLEVRRPLGDAGDSIPWVSETTIAPWVVYVLGRGE